MEGKILKSIDDNKECPPDVHEVFEEIKARFGLDFVPNFFLPLANSPTGLQGMWSIFKNTLFNGLVSRSDKELIFLTIALKLNCKYCSSLHLAVAHKLKIEGLEEVLTGIKNIKNKKIRLILQKSLIVAEEPKSLSSDDYKELMAENLSMEEIIEVFGMAALSTATIKMAQLIKVDVDNDISEYLQSNELEKFVASGV
jgi:AhpD family alkylhydroperoxidase